MLEPLINSGGGSSIRISGVEVQPLEVNTRNNTRPGLGLRNLFSRSSAVVQYSFEHVTWTREDAGSVLEETLGRRGVTAPIESLIRRSNRFGTAEDWAAIEAGGLPATVGNEFVAAPVPRSPADFAAR